MSGHRISSYNEIYSDDFESDSGSDSKGEKSRHKYSELNADFTAPLPHSKKFSSKLLPKAHSSNRCWQNMEKSSCFDLSREARMRSMPKDFLKECIVEASKKVLNPNALPPVNETRSMHKPAANLSKQRRATVPAKALKQGTARQRSNTHGIVSGVSYRKKNALKSKISAPPAKQNTANTMQGLLAEKIQKIDDLRNQIIDLRRQLEETQKEKKTFQKMCNRQQKELEESRVEIPEYEKAHDEELRVVKTKNRNLQERIKDIETKLSQGKDELKRQKSICRDMQLRMEQMNQAEAEFGRRLNFLKNKMVQKDERIKALDDNLVTIKQEFSCEIARHEDTKVKFQELQNEYGKLLCSVQERHSSGTFIIPTLGGRSAGSVVKDLDVDKDKNSNSVNEKKGSHLMPELLSNPNVTGPEERCNLSATGDDSGKDATESCKNNSSPSRNSEFNQDCSFAYDKLETMDTISLPNTADRERRFYSRLQDLSLNNSPLIIPTSSRREEGEFAIFTGNKSRQLNSKSTCLALDDVVTTKFTRRDIKRRR